MPTQNPLVPVPSRPTTPHPKDNPHTSPQVLSITLNNPTVQVETPLPASSFTTQTHSPPKPAYLTGTVTVRMLPHLSPQIDQLDICLTGTIKVDTHKLSLGWIKGGPVTMRSANSAAADPVHRRVYYKSVTLWKAAGAGAGVAVRDDDFEFSVLVGDGCPSSVGAESYRVEYSVQAVMYGKGGGGDGFEVGGRKRQDSVVSCSESVSVGGGSGCKGSRRVPVVVSEAVAVKVLSVRSQEVWERGVDGVSVSGGSLDGLVSVEVGVEREEVLIVSQSSGYDGEEGVKYVDLDMVVRVKSDVDRVESLDAFWKQNTEFRFTAIKHDLENRTVMREKARVDHPRKLADQVTLHIPISTKTVTPQNTPTISTSSVSATPTSTTTASTSTTNASTTTKKQTQKQKLRISTCSADNDNNNTSHHKDTERGSKSAILPPPAAEGNSPVSMTAGGGLSPLRRSFVGKRKSSLPDLGSVSLMASFAAVAAAAAVAAGDGGRNTGSVSNSLTEVDEGEEGDGVGSGKTGGVGGTGNGNTSGNGFKPFSFLRRLVGGSAGSAGGDASSVKNVSTAVTVSQPSMGRFGGAIAHAISVQQMNQDLKYVRESAGIRSLKVRVRVPLVPKDMSSKNARLAGTRLQEVVRTHFVVVRVKYHVKKERVHGPLRHDRYVEVMLPLRLVNLRE
ncbi:hypothetical protein HDU79_009189 [Rhizoclosmatium sp. JEL0117]|nr:hypothetical protein HDU79_009189 [Rhizoclosmatium sp. JEL0117]